MHKTLKMDHTDGQMQQISPDITQYNNRNPKDDSISLGKGGEETERNASDNNQ